MTARRFRRRVAAGTLVAAGLVWILVNGPVEGATLVVLTYNHGITVADLASVAAFAAGGVLWWRS